MKRALVTITVCLGLWAVPAHADEEIGTIQRGTYVCELPGDATGLAGVELPEETFRIESASRYSSQQGGGTYLRRGDEVIMTSGPRNGDTYRIISRNFLRKLVDGEPSRLRCVRQSR